MGNEGKKELHKRIYMNLLWTLMILLCIVFVVPPLIRFFMPLIVAWIIAAIANPMVRFLENKIKIMRKHGSVIVIVLVLLAVGALLYGIGYVTVAQVSSLIKDLPGVYEQVVQNLQDSLGKLHQHFDFIPDNISELIDKNDSKLNSFFLSFFDSLKTSPISAVGSFASSLIDIIVMSILTLMISYFFVVQRNEIKATFKKYLPKGIKDIWNVAMDTCIRALAGYIKVLFKIMIIIFAILFVIFGGILHAKYAVVLALVTAFLDFLPFLGTGIIITPWAIYCALTGDYLSVVVLVITYFVSLLAHRLLEPKLVSDNIGMSPFATLLFMFIGYRLIGVLGLIVGIPVGMIVVAFVEQGIFDSQIRGIRILLDDWNEYRKY